MKKKLTALFLAAVMLLAFGTAFAQDITVKGEGNTKAIILCYDNSGALVYSNLLKSTDGTFNTTVPSQYDSAVKKLYFIDTQEFKNLEDAEVIMTPEPQQTPEPTEEPKATVKPAVTAKPSSSSSKTSIDNTPYEREVDEIYAPALVTDVATSSKDGDDVYTLTVFYLGNEVTIDVDSDILIESAPDAYSYMKGKDAGSLKKGDVVWMTANIGGDEIRTIDFITRPTDEDIVTGNTDYGDDFEQLFASNGLVAGRFSYFKYGEDNKSDKYQYAYGIVGRMKGTNLTLLNKKGVIDDAISIGVNPKAYVYTCDVSGREYEFELGDIGSITTAISQKEFRKDAAELNADYSYNYALVRMVNGTATDIVIFSNYNND